MGNQMNRKSRIWLIIGLIVVVAVLAGVWASYTFENFGSPDFPFRPLPPSESNPADLEFYYIA